MRLLLSIPSLAAGGAERQFAALASGLAARGHQVTALTLGPGGPLAQELGGARHLSLGKASRSGLPRAVLALAGLLRHLAPDAHYAFLPGACVPAGLATLLAPGPRLVFGVRASGLRGLPPAGRLLRWLEARLSRRAALVIANSRAGHEDCLARGFPAERLAVAANGIDTARFRPERALGAALREQWGAGDPATPLVGMAARLDPMKDHATFLTAAAALARRMPEVRFVCVGGGGEGYARSLRLRAQELGLAERLVWAGPRADMERVYNALDVCCLCSAYGEGFSNALGEAMACGVPCAATNVGDAADVIGGTGALVPPGRPEELAKALCGLLERGGAARLGAGARARAVAEHSLAGMVLRTEALLAGL
jgi:glycosyltransferase involved in cell wall biosynthesis